MGVVFGKRKGGTSMRYAHAQFARVVLAFVVVAPIYFFPQLLMGNQGEKPRRIKQQHGQVVHRPSEYRGFGTPATMPRSYYWLKTDPSTGMLGSGVVGRNYITGRLESRSYYFNPATGERMVQVQRFNPFTRQYETIVISGGYSPEAIALYNPVTGDYETEPTETEAEPKQPSYAERPKIIHTYPPATSTESDLVPDLR